MLIYNYRYFLFSEHDFKNICFYLGDNILPLTVTCYWLINGWRQASTFKNELFSWVDRKSCPLHITVVDICTVVDSKFSSNNYKLQSAFEKEKKSICVAFRVYVTEICWGCWYSKISNAREILKYSVYVTNIWKCISRKLILKLRLAIAFYN